MATGPTYCDVCGRAAAGSEGDSCPYPSQLDPSSPCPGHLKADWVPDPPEASASAADGRVYNS